MKKPLPEEAKTFGDWAYLALAKHFRKMLKHEAEVLKDKDPEELHEMRIGMRRLRTAIEGFSPALNLPKAVSNRNVARIARMLGKLRDIDVLQDTLQNQYYPNLPKGEQKSLKKALKDLGKKRSAAFEQVAETLHSENYYKLKHAFKNWLEEPSYQDIAALPINHVLPDLLLPQINKLLVYPGWLIGVKVETGEISFPEHTQKKVHKILAKREEILHDLRKQAKRTRYQMDLFTIFYDDKYKHYVARVKEIQTVLGELQDSSVLKDFLSQVFATDMEKIMPTFAEQLKKIRYQKWQDWHSLQRYFLAPQNREELRLITLGKVGIGDWG